MLKKRLQHVERGIPPQCVERKMLQCVERESPLNVSKEKDFNTTRGEFTLSKGRATALWPWGRPWPGPKGSGQGPAEVGPGPWGQARAGPDPALLINHVIIT